MSAVKVTLSRYSVFECNLQFSPILDFLNYVFIILDVRDIDNRIGQYSKINETGTSIMGMKEMLSHEIKNPLTPMRLTVQSFQRKFSEKKLNHFRLRSLVVLKIC